jgi:hypothetical protein
VWGRRCPVPLPGAAEARRSASHIKASLSWWSGGLTIWTESSGITIPLVGKTCEIHNTSKVAMIQRVGIPRQGVVEILLSLLHPLHPVPRPGVPPNHIAHLALDIQANGYDLSQAIPVARMPNGRFVQLGGHHRAEAMRQLGETTIPARIVDWDTLSPVVQHWWQQRFPLFPWQDFLI